MLYHLSYISSEQKTNYKTYHYSCQSLLLGFLQVFFSHPVAAGSGAWPEPPAADLRCWPGCRAEELKRSEASRRGNYPDWVEIRR